MATAGGICLLLVAAYAAAAGGAAAIHARTLGVAMAVLIALWACSAASAMLGIKILGGY